MRKYPDQFSYTRQCKIQMLDNYFLGFIITAVFFYLGALFFSSGFLTFVAVIFSLLSIPFRTIASQEYKNGVEEAHYYAQKAKINAERKKAEEKAKQKKYSSLPRRDVAVSSEKIKNNTLSDMGEIKYSRPRNGQKLFKYSNFVVIDIETTGLKATEKIIEIAAVRYEYFKPVEVFTTLLNPEKPIPSEATKINHITDSMVSDKPTFKSIIPALEEFVGKSDIIGQNLPFDLKFLYRYGYDFTKANRKYYDTLDIAKSKLKKFDERKYERNPDFEYDVDDYKLGTLCEYYNIDQEQAHRALGDCYATAQLFEAMLRNEYDLVK